jgi:ring-1,2-phenylacetyl-CoA epoxidase subunit PaaE
VLTPDGLFTTRLDPARHKRYAAFAAGSGITPILSLVKTILRREPHSRLTLVYGNRRQSDVLFLEELEELKDRYLSRLTIHYVFSREPQDVALFNGRLDAEKIRAFTQTLIPPDRIDEAFICGPGAMIDDVEQTLNDCGVATGHIHVERFGVPDHANAAHRTEPGDSPRATVSVIIDGVRRQFDFHEGETSLIDAARAAGIELPYSCKGGMCCTCRARLVEGEVRMERNYSLEREELDAGFVLTCQSHPLTETLTLNFDER